MSFQEKNIAVSLGTFSLILAFFLLRIFQLVQTERFESTQVFRLWGIVIALGIIATIVFTIIAHIVSGIVHKVKTNEDPDIKDIKDERDQLIDFKGTQISYLTHSIGTALSMLAFVLGQPALVMFTLLILSGLLAQIIGDISRLVRYRRGF